MVMDTLQTISAFKILMVAFVLAGASIMDIRFRRIPDRFWMVMMAAGIPLLAWEMWLKGAQENPMTLFSLLLPLAGFLFILFGYPEPSQVLKGSIPDILFSVIYISAITGGIIAFLSGDRGLFSEIGVSMIFMALYFVLYAVPIGGARLIHGGADAKCLIALAGLFPWYVSGLPFQLGPFYSTLVDIPSLGTIFPTHLSVLFNGAVISAVIVLIVLPLKNILKGNIKGLRPTSYMMDIDDVEGSFVWMIMDDREKKDPRPKLVASLKKKGVERIRVTPKIPFILYLFMGFAVHSIIGNIVLALILI